MSANELLHELENLGIRLWEESGKLHFRAPKGVMTVTRRAALAAQKDQVLALLRAAAAPIRPHPTSRHEPFPLTDVQAAYFLGRRKGFLYGGVGCHAYGELMLEQVDPERLSIAWRHLICRHDMLRAVILPNGSQQVLAGVPDYQIKVVDLRSLGSESARYACDATRAELDHRVYDPGKWPLFDLRVSLMEGRSRLHISIDLLIADYVSIFVLLDELRRKYEQPDVDLPELSLTFRDYLMARSGHRSGLSYERHRTYWLDRVDGFPMAPDLPVIELPATADDQVRFRRWEFTLDQDAWRSLARQATGHGLTLSCAVLAAYAEVIGRWSRHQRFAIDVTLLNRPPLHPDIACIVGDFTTVSLLEVDHRVAAPFSERARRIQERLGQDLDHVLFSGIELIRELARRRGTREALMPIVYTSALGLSGEAGEIPMGELVESISQTPQVWIDCQVMERGDRLCVNWDVRQRVFPDGLMDTIFASFETLIRSLVSEEVWDARCPVPIPPEQAARRAAVNGTQVQFPEGTLVSGFLAWAHLDPRRPCVLAQDGMLTYGEVLCRAGAVQKILESAGVKPGEFVAVLADKGPMQLIAVLGVLLAGAAYLPIDAGEPLVRRDEIISNAGVRLILSDTTLELASSIRQINLSSLTPAATPPPPASVSADQLAYVIYTSGSTGKPKGVVITHRAALNTIHDVNARFGIGANDVVLCVSRLAFDLSVYDIFGLLTAGGALVFPTAARRTDPTHWAELIAHHRITVWNSVPGLMGMLQDCLAARPDVNLTSLRLALLSGDRIPVELVKRIRARMPAMELIALGGATEGSIWSIVFPLHELPVHAGFVPYGRPLANQNMHVLDDALRPCPDGVTGEICIGGAGLAVGYLGDEVGTRQRFMVGPNGEGRLYRTGDLGRYLPDGNIEILGRDDAQIKIRGYRVELGEIEAALAAHPAAARAVVTTNSTASGHRRVMAFVEPARAVVHEAPDLLAKAEAVAAASSRGESAKDYLDYARALDWAALASIMHEFRRVGLFADGASHSCDQIVASLVAPQRYHRLIRRWLRSALNHGILNFDQKDMVYRVTKPGLALDAADAWRAVEQRPHDYDSPVLLQYFRASCENLLALIRGNLSPLELLYPQGRTEVSISLYEHSFFNRWGNNVAAAIVTCMASTMERGKSQRVLEIGGGVGGTTASILGALRQPYEYWFTDVTQYFLNTARDRFGENTSLHFALYDLNRDYREQGFSPNSFDLIVAGDVLHVARNVPRVLSQLRELLAPGGWLVAIEMTRDHCQIMTSLELLNTAEEVGPLYEDDREKRDQSFYTRDEWVRLFKDSQTQVELLPRPEDAFSEFGLCVFAARFKTDRMVLRAEDIAEFLRKRLPDYMLPAEIQILDQIPLTANGKVDRSRLHTWEARGHSPQLGVDAFESDFTLRLAGIWKSTLGLAQASAEMDFFAAGGDSLLAAQLTGRIIEELPEASAIFFDDLLRRVLEGPTLPELSQTIVGDVAQVDTSQAETQRKTLVSLGGASNQQTCLFIHDATPSHLQGLSQALAAQFRLFEVSIDSSERSRFPQLAAHYLTLVREANITDVHLVGSGLGNLLVVELGRQMLESGNDSLIVTVTSLGGDATSGQDYVGNKTLYVGDLNLIRLNGDHGADAYWRTLCLGHLCVMELDSPEPGRVAQLVLEASSR